MAALFLFDLMLAARSPASIYIFEIKKIDQKYKKLKYQIILSVAEMHIGLNIFSGKDFEAKCECLIKICDDSAGLTVAVNAACQKIDQALSELRLATHLTERSKDFTNKLITSDLRPRATKSRSNKRRH